MTMNQTTNQTEVSPAVLVERDGRGVLTLTMNRPGSFNALSEEMLAALQTELDRAAKDDGLRVVVLDDGPGRW